MILGPITSCKAGRKFIYLSNLFPTRERVIVTAQPALKEPLLNHPLSPPKKFWIRIRVSG